MYYSINTLISTSFCKVSGASLGRACLRRPAAVCRLVGALIAARPGDHALRRSQVLRRRSKTLLEYGVWAAVFYGDPREQTGGNGFPRQPAGRLFCSYRISERLRNLRECMGTRNQEILYSSCLSSFRIVGKLLRTRPGSFSSHRGNNDRQAAGGMQTPPCPHAQSAMQGTREIQARPQ